MSESDSVSIVTIYKTISISSSHKLNLPYDSKCNNVHGHNFKFEVWISGSLDGHGMVIDFHKIKSLSKELDHKHLNDILDKPTAENLAIYFYHKINSLENKRIISIRVRVWETETAYAEFEG